MKEVLFNNHEIKNAKPSIPVENPKRREVPGTKPPLEIPKPQTIPVPEKPSENPQEIPVFPPSTPKIPVPVGNK